MKILKILIFLLLVVFVGYGLIKFSDNKSEEKRSEVKTKSSPSPATTILSPKKTEVKTTKSIFVPYWTDSKNLLKNEKYDRYIYFGVSVNAQGLNKFDPGYQGLSKFVDNGGESNHRLLTVRMLNQEENVNILKNKKSWSKIIDETFVVVKDYNFNGVVLDLEISALPFTDLVNNINEFVELFYSEFRGQDLYFAITLYADTFYRKRPYDVAFLSKNADEIMIMAYDFHKAGGEPGPNFPLSGKDKYDYNYQLLINDLSIVPSDKLSFIFGMYGYDWIVDEKKRPIKPATSLSLLEVNEKFVSNCAGKNCVVLRDPISSETEVNYVDDELRYHIVWFEDQKSVEDKQKFLKKKGIGNFIYWAYGYY